MTTSVSTNFILLLCLESVREGGTWVDHDDIWSNRAALELLHVVEQCLVCVRRPEPRDTKCVRLRILCGAVLLQEGGRTGHRIARLRNLQALPLKDTRACVPVVCAAKDVVVVIGLQVELATLRFPPIVFKMSSFR
jgi:hypothetical protein